MKENSFLKNKKNFIPIIGIVVAVVILLIIYITVFNNSKNVFLRAINKEYNKLNEKFEEVLNSDIVKSSKNNSVSSKIKFDFDVDVDKSLIMGSDYEAIIDEINKLNFEFDGVTDSKNKKFNYDLKVLSDDEKLINVLAYGKDKSVYFELKNIFDKYIEVPVEEYDKLFDDQTKNIDKVQYISKIVKNSFLNNLNEKDFTKKSVYTYLNGKKVKTNKITYKLSEKSVMKLTKKVLMDLKNNEKFIKECSNLTEKSTKEIKSSIDQAITNLSDELKDADSDYKIELSLYTKGLFNKSVKYEINIIDDDSLTITYSNYKNVKVIELYNNDEKVLTSKTIKIGKEKYKTSIKISTIEITINSNITDKKSTHKISLEANKTKFITGSLITTSKEVKKGKQYKNSFNFNIFVENNGTNLASLKMNGTNDIKIGTKVSIPNLNNSIKYNEMTSENLNTIMSNLMNDEEINKILNNYTNYSE